MVLVGVHPSARFLISQCQEQVQAKKSLSAEQRIRELIRMLNRVTQQRMRSRLEKVIQEHLDGKS